MTIEKKEPLPTEQEDAFFYWLGVRLFTTVLRGIGSMGHRRPLSAARDYLRSKSVPEGVERDACEFLIDVTKMGRGNRLRPHDMVERWGHYIGWMPTPDGRHVRWSPERGFLDEEVAHNTATHDENLDGR